MYSHLRYSVRNGNDNEMESFTLQESVKHEDCNQAQHGALYSRWLEDRGRGQREYSSRFISQLRAEPCAHQRAGTCVCRAADEVVASVWLCVRRALSSKQRLASATCQTATGFNWDTNPHTPRVYFKSRGLECKGTDPRSPEHT